MIFMMALQILPKLGTVNDSGLKKFHRAFTWPGPEVTGFKIKAPRPRNCLELTTTCLGLAPFAVTFWPPSVQRTFR
jgi:hypothetical protein